MKPPKPGAETWGFNLFDFRVTWNHPRFQVFMSKYWWNHKKFPNNSMKPGHKKKCAVSILKPHLVSGVFIFSWLIPHLKSPFCRKWTYFIAGLTFPLRTHDKAWWFPENPTTFVKKCHRYIKGEWSSFFLVNRVVQQKLKQSIPYSEVWLIFWCSTRPSADTGTN